MQARQIPGGDSGFTLVEVVVAMAVFAVMAASVLGILVQIGRTTGENLRRTTASNIASQQIEAVRALDLEDATVDPLPLGRRPATYQTVGKITYKIVQTNRLATQAIASVCDSTGIPPTQVQYRLVTVAVSWPNMGRSKAVQADTLKSVNTFNTATAGNVAMSVTGFDGPLADVPVTLTPATGAVVGPQSTGDDGCTAFAGFPIGTYTATPYLAGHVGITNTISPPVIVGVANSTLVRSSITYAAARSAAVVLDPPVGSTVATGIPLRLGGTYPERTLTTCTGASTSECTTGLPGTIKNVYPSTYTVKAGACIDASASSASVALAVPASTVPTVSLPLGAITVRVQTMLGAPVPPGRPITILHSADASCASGESYATTSVAAGSTISLPYGAWTVRTNSLLGVPSSQNVTLTPTSPATRTQSVILSVIS